MLILSSDHFALLLLDICIGSWMLRNWLAGLLQPYLVFVLILVLRLVSVAVLWLLCLLLAMFFCLLLNMLFCLLLAMLFCLLLAMLFSVLFIISLLLDVKRCSASASSLRCSSRCPCTRVALFRSSRYWPVGRGSVKDFHHLLLGCGSFCTSCSPLALGLWLCL